MKYYKDVDNQVYAYENNVLEFGRYTEVDVKDASGKVVTKKIYPEFTVKEGLIAITEAEANNIANPPKSDEAIQAEIVARNTAIQVDLTKEANAAISILQDAVDLDMAEDGDEDKLKAWKKYRVLLSRVDIEQTSKIEWPEKPI